MKMQHHHENQSVNVKVVPNEVLLNEGFPGFENRFLSSDRPRGGQLQAPGKELRSTLYMSEIAAKKSIHFYSFLSFAGAGGCVSQSVVDKHSGQQCRGCRWPQLSPQLSCAVRAVPVAVVLWASPPHPAPLYRGPRAPRSRLGRLELPRPRASPEEEEEEGFHRAPFPAAPVSVRTRNPHRRVLRRH